MRVAWLIVLVLSLAVPVHAISLIPGTLLGVKGFFSENSITQYDTSGAVLDSLRIADFASYVGVTTIDGELYTLRNGTREILRVDLDTGTLTKVFDVDIGVGSMGRLGSQILITGTFSNRGVLAYDTAGTLRATIPIALPDPGPGATTILGVDGDVDGGRVFVGDGRGRVTIFDTNGALLDSFHPGITGLSGLAYDPTDDSLWVGYGFSDEVIRHYDLTGTLLGEFAALDENTTGLTFVPIPEPTAIVLTVLGLMGARSTRGRNRS